MKAMVCGLLLMGLGLAPFAQASEAALTTECEPAILASLVESDGAQTLEDAELAEIRGAADPDMLLRLVLSAMVVKMDCDKLRLLVLFALWYPTPEPEPCPPCPQYEPSPTLPNGSI